MLIDDPINQPTTSTLRNLMNLVIDPVTNMSLLWTRRDILGYEFECGSLPSNCVQCTSVGMPPGSLPDDFNQQIILKNLLVWQACPSEFFCPQALSEPIACPASRPWSAPGSSEASNCTCRRGTFFNSTSQTCQPCRPASACSTGQYMAGWTLCMLTDGATNSGVCMPCQNLPHSNATYTDGPGIEAMTSIGKYIGICSFECPYGSRLYGGGGCFSAYACTPIIGPILQNSNQKLVYSSTLAGLHDSFKVVSMRDAQQSFSSNLCEMQRDLSQAINIIANGDEIGGILVSTSCAVAMRISGATICNAPAVCVVTANATIASDYTCEPCPLPPKNGFYSIPELAFSCKVTCSAGFYFNASSGNCSSCTAFETQYCSPGYFLKGQGCYGDQTPFPTLDPSVLSTHNCVLCNKPQPSPGSNQWLWLSDPYYGCSYQTCSILTGVGVSIYIVSDCKNTSDYVTAACIRSCDLGFWMKGTCSQTTTAVCTACTTQKPGYYLIAACTQYADSVWQECGVIISPSSSQQPGDFTPGYYCNGDGAQQPCPNNKTSQRLASSIGGDCFCPAGTINAADLTCAPTSCQQQLDNSVLAPGAGGISVYYMFTNMQSLHTDCALCGSNNFSASSSSLLARSKGDGIGLASCMCPPNTYAEFSDTHISACFPCPVATAATCTIAATGNNFVAIPDTCWAGGTVGAPQCQCIPPPFTTLNSGTAMATCSIQNPSTICQQGFDPIQASIQPPIVIPAEPPSGSTLYISRAQSLQGWNLFHAPSAYADTSSLNYEIKRLAVTSDLDSWYFQLKTF